MGLYHEDLAKGRCEARRPKIALPAIATRPWQLTAMLDVSYRRPFAVCYRDNGLP
jgi:hypothetical protein